eukprot:gene3303-5992_t
MSTSVKRRLRAMQHPMAASFNHRGKSDRCLEGDEGSFRNLVSTLEDSTIRFYKVEDRGPLRNIDDDYLVDLECPYAQRNWKTNMKDRYLAVDWLLGHAVSLDFHDNADNLNSEAAMARGKTSVAIDVKSEEVRTKLHELASLLQLPVVSDDAVMWRAISKLISRKFSPEAITASKLNRKDITDRHSLAEMPLGFSTGDPTVDEGAKILRLLHLAELRNLQTKINELIGAAQDVTADPKTDSSLARVGK